MVPAAMAQIEAIDERVRRIGDGIGLLEQDSAAFEAFRFANEAIGRSQFRAGKRGGYKPGRPLRRRRNFWVLEALSVGVHIERATENGLPGAN